MFGVHVSNKDNINLLLDVGFVPRQPEELQKEKSWEISEVFKVFKYLVPKEAGGLEG